MMGRKENGFTSRKPIAGNCVVHVFCEILSEQKGLIGYWHIYHLHKGKCSRWE